MEKDASFESHECVGQEKSLVCLPWGAKNLKLL